MKKMNSWDIGFQEDGWMDEWILVNDCVKYWENGF
jgi:hypothetical protein